MTRTIRNSHTEASALDVEPRTLVELRTELSRVARESSDYWRQFSLHDFYAPLATNAWSPADHLRHLTKSIRPVAEALRLPRFVIRLIFGAARGPSRSFGELRDSYRTRLAAGGRAGRFAPRPLAAAELTESTRERLLEFHTAAVERLSGAIARWDELSADRLRVPHPLLGKLTVREMLFFTLIHNVHHVQVVERRMSERGQNAT